ncbi:LOW QUALITY PROTEIN: telomere repeats-binding bouquet formation protein 1 [Gastrophryne carolinensis]
MKTDLNLLLECIKFQMDCPESQRDTLAAVCSICQNNSKCYYIFTGDASEYFRDIGGLIFIVSLAKSSTSSILKEATLYTLGVFAESSVFCQQALCSLKLFEDIHVVLSNEQSSVSLKRISVFLLLVLVSNNKAGQGHARESGCIDLLLLLFSSDLVHRMLLSVESTAPQYQLWQSVCSALCACVNNPQNEENQKLCSSAFPQAMKWLQLAVHPDIVRPMCSLIGLSVANNCFAQDHFNSIGGLDTLANLLLKLMNGLQTRQLAVVVTKTLDACISENARAVHHLSKHRIVSSLTALLSGDLDPEDRFSIVLALGHCTEGCELNQYELLKSNGLPLIIQMLTETQDDQLHKAAMFVLQNCREMSEEKDSRQTLADTVSCMACETDADWPTEFQESPTEHMCRDQDCRSDHFSREAFTQIDIHHVTDNLEVNFLQPQRELLQIEMQRKVFENYTNRMESLLWKELDEVTKSVSEVTERVQILEQNQESTVQQLEALERAHEALQAAQTASAQHTTRALLHLDDLENRGRRNNVRLRGLPETPEHSNLELVALSIFNELLGHPMTLCADIISKEISSTIGCHVPQLQKGCFGCLITVPSMNSRNCSKLLLECPQLCSHHKVILQAEEQYKTEIKKSLLGTRISSLHNNIQLTPLRKGNLNVPQKSVFRNVEHLNGLHEKKQKTNKQTSSTAQNPGSTDLIPSQPVPRKDFTQKEVADLLDGVRKFGRHWNAILWSYPFQKGRKNVDLAKKYKQLQQGHLNSGE